MPEPGVNEAIASVLGDASLSRQSKVARLRQLEADALAKQRGGTEGLEPDRPDDGEELRAIERALMSLGETAVDQGPASL
ncbi:hypothetical protein GCM10011321_00610 [Youhaiella tibetensis]|uniref:Uncharacterized protein n=1 Tax=Paradevosia tibetensis TaxID=1447062 RepID=A0A5B9DSF0_9HYPH|nr:hypothetical protein [Youhaiella tibetensis]AKR56674.1 hypothetical protein XM25_12880 [Devosia sp. H5989]QEE21709.1 hypothetical protein FNA67_16605 [Youhaiella tibetensis]GGF12413.1 hypothetical protein GCM10011321_00610 [Youhaiella tibetensis]